MPGIRRGPCDIDDTRAAQLAVLAVHDVAARFRGAICRLITDDKGTRFLLACGVPGFAAQNDANAVSLHAWRAVQIAVQCHTALAQVRALPRSAVTTHEWWSPSKMLSQRPSVELCLSRHGVTIAGWIWPLLLGGRDERPNVLRRVRFGDACGVHAARPPGQLVRSLH